MRSRPTSIRSAPAENASGPCARQAVSRGGRSLPASTSPSAPERSWRLLGENGAGKSTLIKCLGGLQQPDEGTLSLDGRPVRIADSAEATRLGIGVIHQELNNLDNLDVAGNVFLGREPRRFGLIQRREMEEGTRRYLRALGLAVEPDAPLRGLSIAQQQLIEIAKALSLDAKYLVMDEPTSSLTAGETARLLEVVAELRHEGRRNRLRVAPPRRGEGVRRPRNGLSRREERGRRSRRMS